MIQETTITLEKVRFYSYHGVMPHENRVGNYFEITLTVHFPAALAMESGRLEETINYALLYDMLAEEMAKPAQLLEAVAHRILTRLHDEFPRITQAKLSLTKLAPPIAGFDGAGVTFTATATYSPTPS